MVQTMHAYISLRIINQKGVIFFLMQTCALKNVLVSISYSQLLSTSASIVLNYKIFFKPETTQQMQIIVFGPYTLGNGKWHRQACSLIGHLNRYLFKQYLHAYLCHSSLPRRNDIHITQDSIAFILFATYYLGTHNHNQEKLQAKCKCTNIRGHYE